MSSNIHTTAQVAAAVGVTDSHVRRLAIRHSIGTKLSERVRVFTDADVDRLRALLHPGMGRKPREHHVTRSQRGRTT